MYKRTADPFFRTYEKAEVDGPWSKLCIPKTKLSLHSGNASVATLVVPGYPKSRLCYNQGCINFPKEKINTYPLNKGDTDDPAPQRHTSTRPFPPASRRIRNANAGRLRRGRYQSRRTWHWRLWAFHASPTRWWHEPLFRRHQSQQAQHDSQPQIAGGS